MPSGTKMRSDRNSSSGLPRHFLDERAEHARALAVRPARAGVVQQREARDARAGVGADERGQRLVRERVAQARRVRQQVPNRDRRRGRARRVALVGRVEVLDDLLVLERRQVVRDGIVEPDVAFLNEHHDGHRRHGLRHRRDAEDRVRRPSARRPRRPVGRTRPCRRCGRRRRRAPTMPGMRVSRTTLVR